MHKAIQEGQALVVDAVLKHGFPVNPIYPGEEALLLQAARAGCAAVVECLLDWGAAIEAKDQQGCTPVMLSAKHGHQRVLTLLLDRGADLTSHRDAEGQGTLILAARYGHVDCLQVLVGLARLLPQRVGVYVSGIRDLKVQDPEDFSRLPSTASQTSKRSVGIQRAWSKVRGAALMVGSFSRTGSTSSRGSGSEAGIGCKSSVQSGGSARESQLASKDDSANLEQRGQSGERVGHEEGTRQGETKQTVSEGVADAERKSKWGPNLLSRVGSFRRALSLTRTASRADSRAASAAKDDQAMKHSGGGGESTFGRLPSRDDSEVVEEEIVDRPLTTVTERTSASLDSIDKSATAGTERPASPERSLGTLTSGVRPKSLFVSGGNFGEPLHPGSRPASREDNCVARMSSVPEDASMDVSSPTMLPSDSRALTAAVATLRSNPTNTEPESLAAKALTRAPRLQQRPSFKVWGKGPTDVRSLMKKEMISGQTAWQEENEDGAKSALDFGSGESKDDAMQTAPPLFTRSNKANNLYEGVGSVKSSSLLRRMGSFTRSGSSDSKKSSTRSDSNKKDMVYVRLSIGKYKSRQEFTSPRLEVPRKTGSAKFVSSHQFRNISSGGGANTRLKLELLLEDAEHAAEGPRSIAVAVEDLDDVLLAKVDKLDGWFVAHDFATRRRVGAVKCVIRSMPEQFYDVSFSGDNALIHAARHGQTDCVRLLLDAGIPGWVTNSDGNTPLIVAAQHGHRATVELLLRHGVDIQQKNKGGLTAMDMAEKHDQMIVFRVLQGVVFQREHISFNLSRWPVDSPTEENDPMEFLKDCYRGQYVNSLLVVEVVKARHLPSSDLSGMSDPYVTLNLNGMKRTTRVVKSSLAPVWNETFEFDDQSLGVWEGQSLMVEVYDWDMVGDADLLGTCSIDISALASIQPPVYSVDEEVKMGQAWFPLRNEDGRLVQGQHDTEKRLENRLEDSELFLRFRFTPAIGRFVEIGIMEARNLPAKLQGKGNEFPSPFATLSMSMGNSYRTKPIKRTSNPKWGDTFRFSAKNMSAGLRFEIHELQLATKKLSTGSLKTLDPTYQSMIGFLATPMTKLFSLANANLKEIWILLNDPDGIQLKNENGDMSAVRIAFNFVVLGESTDSWMNNWGSVQIERNSRLPDEVVKAIEPLIQAPDLEADAVCEFEKLSEKYQGVQARGKGIPLDGMIEAVKSLSLDISADVVMLRMLINTVDCEHVSCFDEFCRVLRILEDQYPPIPGSDFAEEDALNRDRPPGSARLGTADSNASGETTASEALKQMKDKENAEKLVRKDLDATVGLRVMFSQETVRNCPELLEESGWSLKDGPGAGTILWVNPYDLDGDGITGDICQVIWDKTGRKGHYKTGYNGDYRLALFQPPKSRLDQKQQARMKGEIVIQKDVPARVGMRCVPRKLAMTLYPELERMSQGKIGTIMFIEPASNLNGVFRDQGSTCEVSWSKSKGDKSVCLTGLRNTYQLALYEEPSEITLQEIKDLKTPHSFSFVQKLILDDNQIGDAGAMALGESLRGNWMLQILSLKRNRIAREGGNCLGLGLQENKVLKEIYLNQNEMGDDGILELCNAMHLKSCVMTILDLQSNQITYPGCRMLAKALVGGKYLTHLFLKDNMVGSDGCELLEQGIRYSTSLAYLDIEGNVMGNSGFRSLMRSLRKIPAQRRQRTLPKNTSLQKINVARNNLTDDCIEDLRESLLKNHSLQFLPADGNAFSEGGLRQIDSLLLENKRHHELESACIKIQCLFRGRRQRIARARLADERSQVSTYTAPAAGDRVQVGLPPNSLPGNLRRYNGMFGIIESLEFDNDSRQWVNVKMDDSIRPLPIRILKKCVTVIPPVSAKTSRLESAIHTENIEISPVETKAVHVEQHEDGSATEEAPIEIVDSSDAVGRSLSPMTSENVGEAFEKFRTKELAGPGAHETPRSGGSARSGLSGISGLSDLAREGRDLLTVLPEPQSGDLANAISEMQSPLATALISKLTTCKWESSIFNHSTNTRERPVTQHAGTENRDPSSSNDGLPSPLERPRTFGGKSIREQDLMLTAARVTLMNMGDALMQQQKAAEEMAIEASRKMKDAAEHYEALEANLKAVILSEDTSEGDVKVALLALAQAENDAIRTMDEAEEADEATRRAFIAMSEFQEFEQEELALEKAISGLDDRNEVVDELSGPHTRPLRSDLLTPGSHMSAISEGGQSQQSRHQCETDENEVSTPESSAKRHVATEKALEQTSKTGTQVSTYYKALKSILEDSDAHPDTVEAAVTDFNRTQDEAILAFDAAIKALEEETCTLQMYQEDPHIFVETMRQDMAEAYARLQAVQEGDGDEIMFSKALSEFSEKNAKFSQLVARAEVFRLGSSWSQSSSRQHSPGREKAVRDEVAARMTQIRERASRIALDQLGEDSEPDPTNVYTTKEEAAALVLQSLFRRIKGPRRTPSQFDFKKKATDLYDQELYGVEELDAILKMQKVTRGVRDRRRVQALKVLGRKPPSTEFQDHIHKLQQTPGSSFHDAMSKLQARFRGGSVRQSLHQTGPMSALSRSKGLRELRSEAALAAEKLTGVDLLSKREDAKELSKEYARKLAFAQGSLKKEFHDDRDTVRDDLSNAILSENKGRSLAAHKHSKGMRNVFNLSENEEHKEEEEYDSSLWPGGKMKHLSAQNQGFFGSVKAGMTRMIRGEADSVKPPEETFHSKHMKMIQQSQLHMSSTRSIAKQKEEAEKIAAARSKFSSTQSYTPEQLEKWKAEDMTAKYMNELDVKALKELEEDVVEDDGVVLVGNQKPEDHQVLTGKEQKRGVQRDGALPPPRVSFPSLKEFQKMSKWKQMRDEALGVACLNI